MRRLPSCYLGPAQLYGARDVGAVLGRLERYVRRFLESGDAPLYFFNACEVDGHRGLYGRDFFTRSSFRRKLAGLGMIFAEDPFVTREEGGAFSCADWGLFRPEFVVHTAFSLDGETVARWEGASLVAWMNTYRFGKVTPDDLKHLTSLSSLLVGVNATEPEPLMSALKGSLE